MADDDLTAELDRIKADTLSLAQTRTPSWGTVPKIQRVIDRTEHLLAAVEAVLNLHQPGRVAILGSLCEHHESCRHFSISRTEADGVRACPDCTATVYNSCTGCGPGVSVDACVTRLAITREITLTSSPPQDGDSN